MTWRELKEFSNGLPESELDKKVIMWTEDDSVSGIEAMTLDEDHYIEKDNKMEGCFPLSGVDYDQSDIESGKLKKVYDAGHPILWQRV